VPGDHLEVPAKNVFTVRSYSYYFASPVMPASPGSTRIKTSALLDDFMQNLKPKRELDTSKRDDGDHSCCRGTLRDHQ
jgi:hypothetical protein